MSRPSAAPPVRAPLSPTPAPQTVPPLSRRAAVGAVTAVLLVAVLAPLGLALRQLPAEAQAFAEPSPFTPLPGLESPPPARPPSRAFADGLKLGLTAEPAVTPAAPKEEVAAVKPESEPSQLSKADLPAPPAEERPPTPPTPKPGGKFPPTPAAPPQVTSTCGTSVLFVTSPRLAAKTATQQGKLLFTLHVSGDFEDPGFT